MHQDGTRLLGVEALRQEALLCMWPVDELPTTFKYGQEEFTYDPAVYGGPVMVLLNYNEAEAASKKVKHALSCPLWLLACKQSILEALQTFCLPRLFAVQERVQV